MLDILKKQFDHYRKTPSALALRSQMRKYLKSHSYHVLMVSAEYSGSIIDFVRAHYPNNTPDELKRTLTIKYLDMYVPNAEKTYPVMLHFTVLFYSNKLLSRDDLVKFFSQSMRRNIDSVPHIFPQVQEAMLRKVSDDESSQTADFFSSFDAVDVTPEKTSSPQGPLGRLEELSFADLKNIFMLCPKDVNVEYVFATLQEFLAQRNEIAEAVQQHVN